MVAHVQQLQQHAGQALAARRAGGLQHHVARGLQLRGQHRVAQQHAPGDGALRRRAELLSLQAHQRRQGQQRIGQQLHAVAGVEQPAHQHRVRQVQRRAQAKVQGGVQRVGAAVRAGAPRHGHGKHQRQHDGNGHRRAALAPGHAQKHQERGRHQQQAQQRRAVQQQLHRQKQRRAQERRRQQVPELAAPGRHTVGRNGDDDAHRGGSAGGRAQPDVYAGGNQQQAERAGDTIEHVVAEQHAAQLLPLRRCALVPGQRQRQWRGCSGAGHGSAQCGRSACSARGRALRAGTWCGRRPGSSLTAGRWRPCSAGAMLRTPACRCPRWPSWRPATPRPARSGAPAARRSRAAPAARRACAATAPA